MQTTVKIEYVGNKQFCIDNVARSGKAWNGKGDIQEVTPAQAKILIKYADQWALAEGETEESLNAPEIIVTKDADGNDVETDASELVGALEKMTCAQLVAYAKQKHGKTLKANRGRKVVLDEVMVLDGHINAD